MNILQIEIQREINLEVKPEPPIWLTILHVIALAIDYWIFQ